MYNDAYFEHLKTIISELFKSEFTNGNSYYSIKHQKTKNLLLLASKLIEKIPDASNAKKN